MTVTPESLREKSQQGQLQENRPFRITKAVLSWVQDPKQRTQSRTFRTKSDRLLKMTWMSFMPLHLCRKTASLMPMLRINCKHHPDMQNAAHEPTCKIRALAAGLDAALQARRHPLLVGDGCCRSLGHLGLSLMAGKSI